MLKCKIDYSIILKKIQIFTNNHISVRILIVSVQKLNKTKTNKICLS